MKAKSKLFVIKNYALKLRASGQLPYFLTKCIYYLDSNSSETYIRFLMFLTENYMRTRKFYHKYKDVEKQANLDIKRLLVEKGFIVDDNA